MSYEIVLAGTFPSDNEKLLTDVQNRLSLHTDSSVLLHREEYEFRLQTLAPPDSFSQPRYQSSEYTALHAKRDVQAAATGRSAEWTLHTHLKPIRSFTKTVVRPSTSIPLVSGDALAFASALGYKLNKLTTRKGYLFTKGSTNIYLFQYVPNDSPLFHPTYPLITSHNPWFIEVIFTLFVPVQSKNMPVQVKDYLDNGVEQILTYATLMKGLVDLMPPDY